MLVSYLDRLYSHLPSMTDHAVCHPLAAKESLREALEDSANSTTSSSLLDVSSSGKKSNNLAADGHGHGEGEGERDSSSGGLTAMMEVSEPYLFFLPSFPLLYSQLLYSPLLSIPFLEFFLVSFIPFPSIPNVSTSQ